MRDNYSRPLELKHGRIDMTHGAGGRASAQLVHELFFKHFTHPALGRADDGAVLPAPHANERLVVASDAHVVSPLFFPGGDIGSLAVNGTINDVAVMGARPLYLSAAFIIEEGFPLADLARIVASMAEASHSADVPIVTGDTKVVERGKGDGVFITTTGIGAAAKHVDLSGRNARPNDKIIVSGPIGNHGIAILCQRENLHLAGEIQSDCAALHELAALALANAPELRLLRDPTRGGLATTLNEIAVQSNAGIVLDETSIPVDAPVAAACEFLGLDPLYVANEGKLIAVCGADSAPALLDAWRAHPLGRQAALIGSVCHDPQHFVQMRTRLGGWRLVDWLTGEQLPRIC